MYLMFQLTHLLYFDVKSLMQIDLTPSWSLTQMIGKVTNIYIQ